MRSAPLVGAARKMVAIFALAAATRQGPASSGGRSGMMKPSTPLAAASVAVRSSPYCSMGL